MRFERHRTFTFLGLLISLLILLVISFAASAEVGQKLFAEKKIVLQISDRDPLKQALVLNVANNLLQHYGPDQIEVEIVAFASGLRLLFKDNVNSDRIQSLTDNGVQFSACANTLRSMSRKLGETPALNPHAVMVSAGVLRIVELIDQGYVLVKP